MPRKRDYIAEILDTRSRAYRRAGRWQQFVKRNHAIIAAFNFLEKARGSKTAKLELAKYFSIGNVASIEAYFRLAIRDLIEHGSPFDENARKLQDLKLDIGIVLDMRREKVSHGELIAHLISLNNLEDINRNMSVIIADDFLDAVQKVSIPSFEKPVLEIQPNLFQDLKDLFVRRHIYCHEIAMKTMPSLDKEHDGVLAAIFFVNATENLIEEILAEHAHH